MRTSRGAAIGVITELVNVEGTLGIGVVALDVPGDGGGGTLAGLLEGHGAGDLGVTAENSNWRIESVRARRPGYGTGRGGWSEAGEGDRPGADIKVLKCAQGPRVEAGSVVG